MTTNQLNEALQERLTRLAALEYAGSHDDGAPILLDRVGTGEVVTVQFGESIGAALARLDARLKQQQHHWPSHGGMPDDAEPQAR